MNRFVYSVLLGLIFAALASCGDGGEDTTPTFSFSGSDVTVVQGGQNKAAIAFAFNPSATDIVTLSLEAPEGITGAFEPATVSIASPNSLLSVNVATSVAPGDYQLTVKGTSGARVNTTTIQLSVEAPPIDNSSTFSLSGTAMTISQGDAGTSTITAAFDAGATDTVTLSLESPDAGITGIFEPMTLSPSSPSSVLTLSVAATVAPDSYELTVTGSSGAKVNSTKVQLVVEMIEEPTEIITPSSSTEFSITLRINGTLSRSQRKAFVEAAQRWSSLITASTGEVVTTIPEDTCGAGFPKFGGTISNVLIDLRVTSIDGDGGVLGQAGPCLVHSNNGLTLYGVMEFDVADVERLEAEEQFGLVILHEMGHVLGFGTLWEGQGKDLLDEPCRSKPGATAGFKGAEAVIQFNVLGETGNPPIENGYGSGTRCSHWDEGVFDNELMTGFLGGVISQTVNPLSALTTASMADLGYEVDLSKAASYSVPACSPSCDDSTLRAASSEEPWEVILQPKGTIDARGNVQFFEDDR